MYKVKQSPFLASAVVIAIILTCIRSNRVPSLLQRANKFNLFLETAYVSVRHVSGSEIKPCNKIDKPLVGLKTLVALRNSALATFASHNIWQNFNVFTPQTRL